MNRRFSKNHVWDVGDIDSSYNGHSLPASAYEEGRTMTSPLRRSVATTTRLASLFVAGLVVVACGSTTELASATSVVVSVVPASASTVPAGTVSFAAAVTGSTNRSVTWSVSTTGGGTVDSSGLYTAPSATGTFSVVATSAADTTKSGSATVTVTATPVVTVSVSPASTSVVAGGTVTFAATVSGTTSGQSTTVTWSVPAGAGSIGASTGVYVAPTTPGTYHVVATSVADPTKSATADVTVVAPTSGNTYYVGPSRTYKNLTAVQAALAPGDTVLVDGNATYPSAIIDVSGTPTAPITFQGVRVAGARPIISGGTNTIEGRGNHVVISGFEITGGSARCYFHHSDHVTLSDSYVHDCPNGVLGADSGSGSLTMESVEIYRCGGGTLNHSVYMATNETDWPGSVFRMQHCYVHDGTGGNAVKSRAERNEIYYNWIEASASQYRVLELIGPDPDVNGNTTTREDGDVVGNVLWGRASGVPFIRVGTDRASPYDGSTFGRYRFVNNDIISTGTSAVFFPFGWVDSIEAHNNAFYNASGGSVNMRDTSNSASGTPPAYGNGLGNPTSYYGTNNWAPTGTTNIPAGWAVTTGASPGFTDVGAFDLAPTSSSPLRDAGGAAPAFAAHPFPNPVFPPAFEPPAHALTATPAARPVNGTIDVGAYEFVGP